MQSLSSNVRAYPLNMSRTAFSKVSKSHQKSAKVSGVVVLAKKKISTLIYNRYIYNIYIIYSYIYIIYIHQHMHRKGATVPPFTYIMLPIYMYIYIYVYQDMHRKAEHAYGRADFQEALLSARKKHP